ncbi:hypothetical protein EG346_17105 [Chryseobacterium carnipullorum]|uniref:Peptidase S24/S26A/S26B/S26C domain-containing protein n=1 Tax=Chryseobacterium carnipullorum TaxID=1124835 RepID=A0A376DVV5_CHRCU|nr:hypothetical protein [Chryseobacterium carnipullorum]AZA49792.1 hypothetical protein EG346_17105 [Chryseobacterium carnipullorum]AZA64683.1 hypothetical protein EG345_08130 [Chryseobacterium carnipullorum]STC95752.1 Uncharacterised protein [Chryseobacterium carnipullorum]
MTASEKLKYLLSYFNTNNNRLGTLINKRQSLYDIDKGKIKSFSIDLVMELKKVYPELNENFLLFDDENIVTSKDISNKKFLSHLQDPEPKINPTLKEVQLKLKKVKENKQKSILPNAQPNIETEKFKVVKLIPEKVAMGLISNFFDSEYVEQLETELIEVDEYFTEDAYKVDSVGESMNDGTARSLLDGDKFLAKDIPRAKWGDKLINGGKNLFYILHSERGHMIKEIIAHDIADKKLTLHSWNKDKKLYPDFEIHTNHCYIIASIQELLSRKMK